jgi:hypothetical protein
MFIGHMVSVSWFYYLHLGEGFFADMLIQPMQSNEVMWQIIFIETKKLPQLTKHLITVN